MPIAHRAASPYGTRPWQICPQPGTGIDAVQYGSPLGVCVPTRGMVPDPLCTVISGGSPIATVTMSSCAAFLRSRSYILNGHCFSMPSGFASKGHGGGAPWLPRKEMWPLHSVEAHRSSSFPHAPPLFHKHLPSSLMRIGNPASLRRQNTPHPSLEVHPLDGRKTGLLHETTERPDVTMD